VVILLKVPESSYQRYRWPIVRDEEVIAAVVVVATKVAMVAVNEQ
jgi:hypothetical protein